LPNPQYDVNIVHIMSLREELTKLTPEGLEQAYDRLSDRHLDATQRALKGEAPLDPLTFSPNLPSPF
jgi:hypothetical protein